MDKHHFYEDGQDIHRSDNDKILDRFYFDNHDVHHNDRFFQNVLLQQL